MPTLTLVQCWFNLVATGEAVVAWVGPDRTRSHAVDGQVETFASGRRRAITQLGEATVVPVLLRAIPLVDVEKLRTWSGQEIEFRDAYGLQVYGTWFQVDVKSYRAAFHDVALVIQATSFTEGV